MATPVLVVPSIPAHMATNARLFVIARVSGRGVEEMRSIIWAKKPLDFPGISDSARDQLQALFSSIGVRTELQERSEISVAIPTPAPILSPVEKAQALGRPSLAPKPATPAVSHKPVFVRAKKPPRAMHYWMVQSGRFSSFVGIILAVAIYVLFPVVGFVFGFLKVPSAELQAALVGWIAGAAQDSIPALEVSYVAKVGLSSSASLYVAIGVLAVLGVVAFVVRKGSVWFWLMGGLLLMHSAISLYEQHRVALLFLGHGMELFFGSLFLWRAFTGTQLIFISERAFYAVFGWLLWLENLRFGWLSFTHNLTADYDLVEGSSLPPLGVAIFVLTLVSPFILLASMLLLEKFRPKALIHGR
jgi:hypothetical protein